MNINILETTINKIYKDPLLKNSIFLISTHIVNAISGFFFWIIAARYYTPDDIGITSAILSSVTLIALMSLIGFPTALIFYLPRYVDRANKIINSCLIIGVSMTIIFSIIFILGIEIWSPKLKLMFYDSQIILIFIISAAMTNASAIMSGSFTAGRRSSYYTIKENTFAISKIFLLILFAGFGTMGIFLSWSVGLIIAVVIGFVLLIKLWKYYPIFVIDPIIKDMASYSSLIYIGGVFYTLPKVIFPIIILNSVSAEFAGYFYIAMTIASLLYSVPISIGNSFLAESSNKDEFWNNMIKSIKFNMSLLIPGTLSLMIFGKLILNVFNPKYADNSLNSLIILAMASIPMSLILIFCQMKNAQNKIKITIAIHGMVAAITFILSWYFMKIWSIEGIATAYLIANTTVAIIIMSKMKKDTILTVLNGKDKNQHAQI